MPLGCRLARSCRDGAIVGDRASYSCNSTRTRVAKPCQSRGIPRVHHGAGGRKERLSVLRCCGAGAEHEDRRVRRLHEPFGEAAQRPSRDPRGPCVVITTRSYPSSSRSGRSAAATLPLGITESVGIPTKCSSSPTCCRSVSAADRSYNWAASACGTGVPSAISPRHMTLDTYGYQPQGGEKAGWLRAKGIEPKECLGRHRSLRRR